MGIWRGVLIGIGLCVLCLVLFFTILGGANAVAVHSARSNLERQVDEQLVQTGASPAMRKMVNNNVRGMDDSLFIGRETSAAEVEAAQASARAARERISNYWRAREEQRAARRAGLAAPRAGSAAPTASARPMVDLSHD